MYDLFKKIEYLERDYDKTQSFFKERVNKIKEDSSVYFNKFTIKSKIKDYVHQNPDRMYKPKAMYQEVNDDLFFFADEPKDEPKP